MSLEVTVNCDECSRIITAAKTGAKARADARRNGARTALPGGRDLCPDCVPVHLPGDDR